MDQTNTVIEQLIVILVGMILLLGCETNHSILPELNPKIIPNQGNTTTTFEFDLTQAFEFDKNQKIFVRWDWEGDSVFDTPFLNDQIFQHRYLQKGDYRPILEIVNQDGETADSSFQISVDQGYSQPRPDFTISPDTGNICTVFSFDATATKDDEDSLKSLKIRWDFEGDGNWDTEFCDSFLIEHIYQYSGYYSPTVTFMDPSGRMGHLDKILEVTLLDTCIKPFFESDKTSIIANEEVVFNASKTYNECKSDDFFFFKWDFNNDGSFDTEWLESPLVSHTYNIEMDHRIRLKVKNSLGLENDIIKVFYINHQNQKPVAKFLVSTYGGNQNTNFRFDCWNSRDLENSPSELLTRWDFNGDGIWDTDYSLEKHVFNRFDTPGEYLVALEVTDSGDLKDTTYSTIIVGTGESETDILMDKRSGMHVYYGTVKIGDQWWFSKDLTINMRNIISGAPFVEQNGNCEFLGYRYKFNVSVIACPEGWHLPSQIDWEELFQNFNEVEVYNQLEWGGLSGFNGSLGGLSNQSVSPDFCSETKRKIDYWSSTALSDVSGRSVWFVSINSKNQNVDTGFGSKKGLSIRCVKN